jgi:hypothetical protein
VRVHGELQRLQLPELTAAETKQLVYSVLTELQKKRFEETLELDLSDPAQRMFGGYELLELIGEGGMGVVYRARQIGLDREVAVKLLAAGPWASAEFVERFRREAQNAARMQHPNIVAIFEIGSEELFFSMRLRAATASRPYSGATASSPRCARHNCCERSPKPSTMRTGSVCCIST